MCCMGIATERQRRRVGWFCRGVHAISCVVSPKPPEAYACPLCLGFFTRENLDAGELTDEHVPPESVGGNPLVLTCRSCNQASGSLLDKFVADEEKLRTFGKPYSVGPIPGSVAIEGIRNNGSIRFDGGKFVMLGDPGQNNPATLAAHTEALERLSSGSSLELRFRVRASPRLAAIGWMRSAYLAAFAVYGYRYVLQPAFEPLRETIANPEGAEFDPVVLQAPDEGALDPLIVEVAAPSSLQGCRAAVFGPRLILLPPWQAPERWFAGLRERLADEAAANLKLASVIGRRFPERPMHLTDG